MNKIVFAVLLAGLIYSTAVAQDPQLSMLTSSPLAINPATTGPFHNCNWRVYANQRDQWASFLTKGLSTSNFSFDMPFPQKKVSLGLLIYDNYAGKGAMNNLTCMASFGYNVKLSKKGGHFLSFGVQGGMIQKSIKISELTWGNQWDPNAQIYDPSRLTGEEGKINESIFYPDFSFGMLYYVNDPWAKFKPWIGVSAYHLAEPDESFSGTTVSKLPRKYIGYLGGEICPVKNISITPMALLAAQGSFFQSNVGISFEFRQDAGTSFQFGGYYRDMDAIVAMVGFGYSGFTFIFDYEVTTSQLKSVVQGGPGGLEFTVRFIRCSKKGWNTTFMRH